MEACLSSTFRLFLLFPLSPLLLADKRFSGKYHHHETYIGETYISVTYNDETYIDETYNDEAYIDETYNDETYIVSSKALCLTINDL